MKKLFTLSLSILLVGFAANAQSNTFVLVEESTNASCPPCASQNPAFDALLAANEDKAITLKYQWYFPGFDPMHNDNPTMANARTAYYGINGVPTGVVNGALITNDCNYYAGAPACLSQADIDAAHNVISPLTMNVSAQLVNGNMEVTGSITADQALNGNLKLRIAIAEKVIDFGSAPGSNGESEFFHVMKTFIGGTAGISLDDFMMGDVYTIDESMSMAGINVYDYTELEVIAFVQNDAGKAVYQTALDGEIEIISNYDNSAEAVGISGIPSSICSGSQSFSPTFRLANQGNAELTSATISYEINGGTEQTYMWTGSLGTLEFEDVVLDPYTFTSMSINTITATVSMPNGVEDENALGNVTTTAELNAPETSETLTIEILTDDYGSETTWVLKNPSGTTVLSGGPYGNNTTYTETYTMPSGQEGCYEFEIFDSFGDGICCSYGEGLYTLSNSDGDVLLTGGEFTDDAAEFVTMTGPLGITENELTDAISVFPNPVSDILNVSYTIEANQMITFDILNSVGSRVMTRTITSNGSDLVTFDLSDLASGVYQLNTIVGSSFSSTSISLVK